MPMDATAAETAVRPCRRSAFLPPHLLLGLALLLQPLLGWAARQDFHFTTLDSRDGLAQNTVNALLQDSAGFVWIATEGGLHRHDGYGLRLFIHDPDDPESLPESFVTAIEEDGDGRLWLGLNTRFLASIDLRSGAIQAFASGQGGPDEAYRDRVSALLWQSGRGLWVGSAEGVDLFDPQSGRRERRLSFGEHVEARLRGEWLAALEDGSVLVASLEGFFVFAPGGTLPRRIGPERSLHTVLVESEDSALVGGDEGLFRWRRGSEDLELIVPAGSEAEAVRSIARDAKGRIWLALRGAGLGRLQPDGRSLQILRHDPDLDRGLPENRIARVMVDRSGLLWVGGEARGVSMLRPEGSRLARVLDTRAELLPVMSNNVRSLHESGDGSLWVGTDGRGLMRLVGDDLQFESHYEPLRAASGANVQDPIIRVFGIADGGVDRLWLASDVGLFEYRPSARRARRIELPLPPGQQRPVRELRHVLRARDGSLWVASFTDGLLWLSADGSSHHWYTRSQGEAEGLSHPLVIHVFEDRDGRIWASTLEGLNLIDPGNRSIVQLKHDPADPESLSGNLVRQVRQGPNGELWVATHSGLNLLRPRPEGGFTVRRFGPSQGLGSSTVYATEMDNSGHVWLSSNAGLARLDPSNGSLLRFNMEDGLQDPEFNGGASLRLRDGRLAFGGVRGINLVEPGSATPPPFDAAVQITAIEAGGVPLLPDALLAPAQIEVPQSERVLRFGFTRLEYGFPDRNHYSYLLEGFDQMWSAPAARNEATYTNLGPGTYTLRVRAGHRDGEFGEAEARLQISVVPAWWNSRWAQSGYLLVLVGLALLLLRRQRRERLRERELLADLREREERLKLSLWGSGDEFWDWDIRSNRLYRVGAEQLLGPGADAELDTEDFRSRAVHPEDIRRLQQIMQAHIAGRTEFFESEHRVRRGDGGWVWVRSRGKVVARDDNGTPIRMAGTARDITASREAERERRIASEVLRSMGEAVAVFDLDLHFTSINPAFSRITGYGEDEVLGQGAELLESSQHDAAFYRDMRDTIAATGQWQGEVWQRRRDGEEYLASLEVNAVSDAEGERSHYVWVVSDITDRKRTEQELRYLANYDTLTGLPNRSMLSERLARAVVRARRQGMRVAVLFLDLDRFKDINDSLGHAAGDRILKSAAARLLATVRPQDTVARLGGDEFTVILEDLEDRRQAEEVAQRVLDAFLAPLEVEGRSEIIITPSIGVSLYPDHALVPTDLLKYADTAMYSAKERGRNTYAFYNEAMDAEARRRASLVSALRRALDRREFYLVFQPRMDLGDGRIAGFEALLRWRSEELGEMSPGEFIPVAEETGLILPIGEWVLREACSVLAGWRERGLDTLAMSINVSVLQLLRGHVPELIRELLDEYALPPARIELEVTESMVMANAEQATAVLHELKKLGVLLAIDDFGTGYSSLVYLKRLPIDTLKVDKEFVGDLTTDPDDEAITATIITMAHSLGLNVVAEGVETVEQLQYLHEQRCDEVQGYLLSRPIEESDCLHFLQHHDGPTLLATSGLRMPIDR